MYTLDYKLPFSTIALICEADYVAKIHFNPTYVSFLSLGVDWTNCKPMRTHAHMHAHAHAHVYARACARTRMHAHAHARACACTRRQADARTTQI